MKFLPRFTNITLIEMPVKIEEPQVILRSVSQKITIFRKDAGTNANWPNYQHANLQIAFKKTKTQWVIDITGARYGIRRALWTWRH